MIEDIMKQVIFAKMFNIFGFPDPPGPDDGDDDPPAPPPPP